MHLSSQSPDEYSDLSFEAIVEQSITGIYVIQDELFVYSNETWAQFFGHSRSEIIGMSLRDLVPPPFIDKSLEMYRLRISGEINSVRYVTPAIHKDGHIVQLEVHGSRMLYRGRPAVVGVGIDVTEQARREDELRQTRNDLQQLAAHINQERERQRALFARELHDVLGGLLASMKMNTQRIMRRVETPELREISTDLMQMTRQAIQSVREMSEELRPSGLDHLGLAPTMQRELRRFAARHSLQCDWLGPSLLQEMNIDRATGIFRIFQEALTNIAKHAQARNVVVRLEQNGEGLTLEIHDDGIGLAPGPYRSDARGLLGMRERARDLNGTLDLQTMPGEGTKLHLSIPTRP
ncbi:sensor histidine kinase [Hydrogenophaga sp.]|uniref:sensor histidine kinase n=1 Tax=Hydrogenophaga sp. TaxID=1904254 RepID=UPI002FC87021